jgi:hypothetical protein
MTKKYINNNMINGLKRRSQHFFYDETKIPSKETIDLILRDAYSLVPLKNDLAWIKAEVFGPEYSEDKHKFCLQTVCDYYDGDQTDLHSENGIDPKKIVDPIYIWGPGTEREKFIQDDLMPKLLEYKDIKIRLQPPLLYNLVQFNNQVLAPWTIVFTCTLNRRGKAVIQNENPLDIKHPLLNQSGDKNAYVQSSMLALVIAGLANENNLDCSFTMGFFPNNYNDNALISKDDKFLMAVSIGVADRDVDYSKADSSKRKEFNKYSNIFKFK